MSIIQGLRLSEKVSAIIVDWIEIDIMITQLGKIPSDLRTRIKLGKVSFNSCCLILGKFIIAGFSRVSYEA